MFQDAIIQTKTKRQSSYFINSTLCRHYKYFLINHPISRQDESGNPKFDRKLSKSFAKNCANKNLNSNSHEQFDVNYSSLIS
jgi:hypothetical protein